MAREDPQLKLRLTEEMKDRVSEAARSAGRSVNAEIVSRLEQSFLDADLGARVERLELELKHYSALYLASERSRKAAEKLNYHGSALLHFYADMLRRYGEGDTEPLHDYVEKAKAEPELVDFQMPEPLEDDEGD